MPAIPMLQFLKFYGLIQLGASDERIVPGRIVTPGTSQPIAYLRHLYEDTNEPWPTKMIHASLPDQLVWDYDLRGKASLAIPAIFSIGGGLQNARKGRFTVSEVKDLVFDPERPDLSVLSLQRWFKIWKKTPKAKQGDYERVKKAWVVESAWYASELTVEFEAPREVNIQAEVERNEIKVGGEAKIEWQNKTTLKIRGNEKVPFAFRGWRIR